jgi:hypothetical protein
MTHRKLLAAFLAGLAAAACGCSSGYPDTEDRLENIDETIRENGLSGQGNDARDKRFEQNVTSSPAVK